MIGGTTHWIGPVIGALLLGSVQQIVTVTISSEINVLVVGVLLVFFVVAAPDGIIGFRICLHGDGLNALLEVRRRLARASAASPRSTASASTSRRGERFGLIGPNGSGKTTLINCISGALRNETGSICFDGEDISRLPAYQRTRRGIARSFQIPRPFTACRCWRT